LAPQLSDWRSAKGAMDGTGNSELASAATRRSSIVAGIVALASALAAAFAVGRRQSEAKSPLRRHGDAKSLADRRLADARSPLDPVDVDVDAVEEEKSLDDGEVGITRAEVGKHTHHKDVWVILRGKVYDVTGWLEDHPGGKPLLLAFAGQDITEPFGTVGHSAIAERHLREMYKGILVEGPAIPEPEALANTRKAELVGGYCAWSGSVKDSADLWRIREHGFLPCRDPVGIEALDGTPWKAFADLVDLLPALGISGEFHRYLDENEELQGRLRLCGEAALNQLDPEQLERAFGVVGYVMLAYWRSGIMTYSNGNLGDAYNPVCRQEEQPAETLPVYIAEPFLALSNKLKRPPMIDYGSTVLYNWARIDPNGPITPSNVRCVLRLTGLVDEEWFFKTHVVIEAEAAHVVSAIMGALAASTDADLLEQLIALEEALWRVVRACLPIMYERDENGVPRCSEHVFYTILRPLIKSGSLEFQCEDRSEMMDLVGPSGAMSSLLPCVDAVLGVQMTSGKLRETLSNFEKSMPYEHRLFLEEIRGKTSIRQRLDLSRPPNGQTTDQHDVLVRSFNRCISRLLDFRWQHWQYVKNFIMKPGNISHAVGSGGTTFDFLQQHITDTENARLTEQGLFRLSTPGLDWPVPRNRSFTQSQSREFWSVDGEHGLLARDPMVSLYSEKSWLKQLASPLREACEVLWSLATRLPALCVARGNFWNECEKASAKLAPLQDGSVLIGMPEMQREHLMTVLCHIASGCIAASPGSKPPRCIERPLQVVARSVGRPPALEFAELIQSNWCKSEGSIREAKDDKSPGSSTRKAEFRVMFRFLASPDEEWYRMIHIFLHDEARDVVSAIRVGQVAALDLNDQAVVGCLVKLSNWFNRFCDYFDSYFDSKDSRTEAILMPRLAAFVAQGLDEEHLPAWVYCCGSSVLLPALHAFLGLPMCPPALRNSVFYHILQEMRVHMPRLHLAFLEELEKPGSSMRHYCYRRFGARNLSVDRLHDLEVAYNDCLNALVRFTSRRIHLAIRIFPHLSRTLGALHSEVEGALRKSRMQLLKMRQRVDMCLDS